MYDFGMVSFWSLYTLVLRKGGYEMKIDLRSMLADECRTLPIAFDLAPNVNPHDPTGVFWNVSFPSPMTVTGEILNTAGYMRMRLDLSLDYVAPCARCLRAVAGNFTFTVEKTVVPKNLADDMDEDALDECAVVEDGFLDIDDELRELLELEFPTRILCKEDCLGLCDRCGKDLNEGPCTCGKEIDPRLAGLADLLAELKAKEQADTDDTQE